MKLSKEQISGLLIALKHTHEDELNCEQFLSKMAELAESDMAKVQACSELQKAVKHVALCPECREEFEMLQDLLDECAEH